MARKCIWCGEPATGEGSMEHVIPKWIPQHLGQTSLVLEHAQAHNVTKREMVPFAKYQARIYCGNDSPHKCNLYFGRELEEKVKPLLVPALDGVPVEWDEAEQRLIAAWAFKTTCAMLGAERKLRAVPQRLRRRFRRTGAIPDHCFVGVGRYTASGIRLFAGRLRLIPGRGVPEDEVVSVYHSTAAFGHVVVKTFGVLKAPPEDTFRVPVGRLYQAWPPKHDIIRWPPLWGLDDDGIDELADYNHFIRR